MGFTKAGPTVEEEGVVTRAGGVDNTASGSDGEVVIRADDESFEGVFMIKAIFGGDSGVVFE